MKKLNFYTKEQNETLKKELNNGRKPSEIIKQYSKEWKRPFNSFSVKVYTLKKSLENPSVKKKMGRPAKVTTPLVDPAAKSVKLRSGFVFDFNPTRAEMHSDHVRLFF